MGGLMQAVEGNTTAGREEVRLSFGWVVRAVARGRGSADERLGVVWPVYFGMLLSLLVCGLLTSGRLLQTADSQPYGPRRDLALVVAQAADAVARQVGLDRPATIADIALGRDQKITRVLVAVATPVPGAATAVVPT